MLPILELAKQFLPSPALVGVGLLPMLVFGVAMSRIAAHLRSDRGVRVAYTRKIFHFGIFSGAAVVQMMAGLPGVVLYGVVISGLVVHAVWRGEGYGFYEAMARPSDAPRRSMFIIVPMITTAVGGVLGNIFFGAFASVGYLACGWGDAIGEPVGSRWGRHRYAVPSLGGVRAERSLEGSAAVCLVASLACTLALVGLGFEFGVAARAGIAAGVAGALVEAVSNHGLDNLTIQVAASATAWLLLG